MKQIIAAPPGWIGHFRSEDRKHEINLPVRFLFVADDSIFFGNMGLPKNIRLYPIFDFDIHCQSVDYRETPIYMDQHDIEYKLISIIPEDKNGTHY